MYTIKKEKRKLTEKIVFLNAGQALYQESCFFCLVENSLSSKGDKMRPFVQQALN